MEAVPAKSEFEGHFYLIGGGLFAYVVCLKTGAPIWLTGLAAGWVAFELYVLWRDWARRHRNSEVTSCVDLLAREARPSIYRKRTRHLFNRNRHLLLSSANGLTWVATYAEVKPLGNHWIIAPVSYAHVSMTGIVVRYEHPIFVGPTYDLGAMHKDAQGKIRKHGSPDVEIGDLKMLAGMASLWQPFLRQPE